MIIRPRSRRARLVRGFDDYLAYIEAYPHDYQMRFEELPEAQKLEAAITTYDRFLLAVYWQCFNPLVIDAGMCVMLLNAIGVPNDQLLHIMPGIHKINSTMSVVRSALQKKYLEDNKNK